jgi:CRISPR-associated protein Csx16
VRTGALLLGQPPKTSSTVAQLLDELQRSKEELPRHIPPLADVLDRLCATVESLRTAQRLSHPDGQRALKALASFYLEMGRYPEAAATIREAWITQHACPKADCPGFPEFSDEQRKAAENAWYVANERLAGEIAETRNDIQHAGYRNKPQPAATIKRKIEELIGKLPVKDYTDA